MGAAPRLWALPLAAALRVAVLEHAVRQKGSANETLEANLQVYETQLEEAARRGAKLLVTSEDGLTGFRQERALWWPYATELPEPGVMPCGAGGSWVLQRLSCMAQQHQVALVASLIELKDCQKQPKFPGCPGRDGRLLLNTAVVLDSDGSLLQKYHKANLWYESALDPGQECAPKTFRLQGVEVPFGIFICADLIHSWPVMSLASERVRHFVMPLDWSNEMAQMQPLGWQQALSYKLGVLLAANARSSSTSGSGIFSEGEVLAKSYDLNSTTLEKLLVAEVPLVVAGASPPCPPEAPAATGGGWETYPLEMNGEHHRSFCLHGTCCRLHYKGHAGAAGAAGYVVALLHGLDASPQVAPWAGEACAIFPCAGGDCLRYPQEALARHGADWFGRFDFLSMEVNFTTEQEVFPQVLATAERLISPKEWHHETQGRWHRLRLQSPWSAELVSLQLYGREYSKDPQRGCPCEPQVVLM